MTREERLAAAAHKLQTKLEEDRKALDRITAAQRAEARKTRDKRRSAIGTLADEAGLLAWEDTTLAGLFQALARLAETPNPVAVLEGLLAGESVP